MPVPVRTHRWNRHGAAALAVGGLAAGLLVAVPSTASAATPLPVATIQGTGRFSPYVGKTVTTTPSVVTAAYPTGGLNGFVVQTPGTGGPGATWRRRPTPCSSTRAGRVSTSRSATW